MLRRRPKLMAILNVTPDSFSDGGRFNSADKALEQAHRLTAEGADILDIGAESTRPGSDPVTEVEELRRLQPVFAALKGAIALPLSIDTYKANVARTAMAAGASIINDVWGLQRDAAMAAVVAETGADVMIMHNRVEGADETIDILDDMDRWFDRSLALARKANIPDDKITLDPGIGFGKTFHQNLIVLANLERLKARGYPLLIGLSRKRFIGAILDAEVNDRLFGTLGANLFTLAHGADIIRVHDVKPHREALAVWMAIDAERS